MQFTMCRRSAGTTKIEKPRTTYLREEQELLSAQAWINYYKRSWEEATPHEVEMCDM